MTPVLSEQTIQTLEILKEETIAAPIDIVFESILEELGEQMARLDGTPLAMKIEPWPGGRWYRDLGNNDGHLWGHIQAIKRPTLIEIYGPLWMSLPATSNVQYRLAAEGAVTRLKFSHRAMGQLPPGDRDGGDANKGWTAIVARIRASAERKSKEAR